jgi:hypothetical protein
MNYAWEAALAADRMVELVNQSEEEEKDNTRILESGLIRMDN